MNIFHFSKLKEIIELISSIQCDNFAEAAVVALENEGKKPGVLLEVEGDKTIKYELDWDDSPKRGGWQESNDFVSQGAIAISFFLTSKLTKFKIFRQSRIGTGFDYWLSLKEEDLNYNVKQVVSARLEISGIRKESFNNTIGARSRKKKKQTNRSDSTGLPAYISIVEFGTPKALFKRKNND